MYVPAVQYNLSRVGNTQDETELFLQIRHMFAEHDHVLVEAPHVAMQKSSKILRRILVLLISSVPTGADRQPELQLQIERQLAVFDGPSNRAKSGSLRRVRLRYRAPKFPRNMAQSIIYGRRKKESEFLKIQKDLFFSNFSRVLGYWMWVRIRKPPESCSTHMAPTPEDP